MVRKMARKMSIDLCAVNVGGVIVRGVRDVFVVLKELQMWLERMMIRTYTRKVTGLH